MTIGRWFAFFTVVAGLFLQFGAANLLAQFPVASPPPGSYVGPAGGGTGTPPSPPAADVCSNISGNQSSLPAGKAIDGSTGNCVDIVGVAGGGSGSGSGAGGQPLSSPTDYTALYVVLLILVLAAAFWLLGRTLFARLFGSKEPDDEGRRLIPREPDPKAPPKTDPPAPPKVQCSLMAVLLTLVAILGAMLFVPAASAATITQDLDPKGGVIGQGYNVIVTGSGFSGATGAYIYCTAPGVTTVFNGATDKEIRLRVQIASTASSSICGLRVLGITNVGYQDFPNEFAIMTIEQYTNGQASRFVETPRPNRPAASPAPAPPPAPAPKAAPSSPPIDRTARDAAVAAARAAQTAQDNATGLRKQLEQAQAELQQLRQAVLSVDSNGSSADEDLSRLAGRVTELAEQMGQVNDRVTSVVRSVDSLASNQEAMGESVNAARVEAREALNLGLTVAAATVGTRGGRKAAKRELREILAERRSAQ